MSSTKGTTAIELIEMLQHLPPDTHVFVDVGSYEWDYSSTIDLQPITGNDIPASKRGAVRLAGSE